MKTQKTPASITLSPRKNTPWYPYRHWRILPALCSYRWCHQIIKHLGPNSWLSKTNMVNSKMDMVDAFKQIPIHPSLWPLHGLHWDNRYYFFTWLVYSSRSSPKISDSQSSAICWIAHHNYNLTNTLHLLEDFLVTDAPRSPKPPVPPPASSTSALH